MGRTTPTHHRPLAVVLRWPGLVAAVAAFLLVSYGGAIVAAPATLPLLYVALRQDRTGQRLRVVIVAVAALTAAEAGWALGYVTVGEAGPWIWLLPLAAGSGTAAAYAKAVPPAEPGNRSTRPGVQPS
jgi:hypothetical protein